MDKINYFKSCKIIDNLEPKQVFDIKNVLKYFYLYMKIIALYTEY